MNHYKTILFLIAVGVMLFSSESCKKDDPNPVRKEVSILQDDFDTPEIWTIYKSDPSGFIAISSSQFFSGGVLSLYAYQGEDCDRKKAERNFEITASIQETLNTSDTLFFDVTIMESSLSASGNLTAVFQFNDLNLRLDLNKEYKEPTSIRVTLVNWVITEVIENETPINDYQITASKGINTNSGVIISADACGADLYAEASLVISHFELSYPKWTID